jgi:hypothetical protein
MRGKGHYKLEIPQSAISRTSHLFRFLDTLSHQRFEVIAGTSMTHKHHRREPDLFSLLLIVVALGMSATLAYQINVYYGADTVSIAKQTPSPGGVGG